MTTYPPGRNLRKVPRVARRAVFFFLVGGGRGPGCGEICWVIAAQERKLCWVWTPVGDGWPKTSCLTERA